MDLKRSLAARITVYLELIMIVPLVMIIAFFMVSNAITARQNREGMMQDRAALAASYLENFFGVIDSEIVQFSEEPYIIRISNQNAVGKFNLYLERKEDCFFVIPTALL